MYELLTGVRPFRAGNLAKLLHQIVYATPAPIHTLRADVPEEIENVVAVAMQKDPARRYQSGLDFAAELTRVHQKLRQQYSRMDQQEQFGLLRRLKFFHEFSHAEIHEVMRASHWQDYASGEEIVKEGEMDDRFYIIVAGNCAVERHGERIGLLSSGECFGETSYVQGAKRTATIRAADRVTVLKVSSTLLEQVSASCQLRFNRVFLRSLIGRLQTTDARPQPHASASTHRATGLAACAASPCVLRMRRRCCRGGGCRRAPAADRRCRRAARAAARSAAALNLRARVLSAGGAAWADTAAGCAPGCSPGAAAPTGVACPTPRPAVLFRLSCVLMLCGGRLRGAAAAAVCDVHRGRRRAQQPRLGPRTRRVARWRRSRDVRDWPWQQRRIAARAARAAI